MLNSFRPSSPSSSSSSSSSIDDSGHNPPPQDKQTVKNFDDTFSNVRESTIMSQGVIIDRYRKYTDPQDASCKTALDLLPQSERFNGAHNEKSNEKLYKKMLEDFNSQLIEMHKFFSEQELIKYNPRELQKTMVMIRANISELDYLITEKSKPNTEGVYVSAKPQPIKLTPSDLSP